MVCRGNELCWKGELEDIKTDNMFFCSFFVCLFACLFFLSVSGLDPLKRENKQG